MGIQKSNKTVEIHILPLQTMQTILLWNWFSLIRFFFKLVFLIRFSILSIIIPCSTKKFILFINFVRKFYLFVLTFLFIVDFIAPLAFISILFLYGKLFLRYAGIVYLTLPTLNKWINKQISNETLPVNTILTISNKSNAETNSILSEDPTEPQQ